MCMSNVCLVARHVWDPMLGQIYVVLTMVDWKTKQMRCNDWWQSKSRRQVFWQLGKLHLNSTVHVPLCWQQHYRRILISYMLCASTSFGRHSIGSSVALMNTCFELRFSSKSRLKHSSCQASIQKRSKVILDSFSSSSELSEVAVVAVVAVTNIISPPLWVFSAAMTVLAIQNPFWDSY